MTTSSPFGAFCTYPAFRRRLVTTLNDWHDLIAAARATLGAHADGEPDALYYLRDELEAQGHIRRDHEQHSAPAQERP